MDTRFATFTAVWSKFLKISELSGFKHLEDLLVLAQSDNQYTFHFSLFLSIIRLCFNSVSSTFLRLSVRQKFWSLQKSLYLIFSTTSFHF